MKKEEVPQDPGACYEGQRRLTWAVGEDGRYEGIPSIGWEAEIAATQVATEAANDRIRQAWEDARAGRTSPLAYHMAVQQMDRRLLAAEAGIWPWRVRRHLRPDVFARLSDRVLHRYAEALAIGPAELCTLPEAPDLL